MDILKFLFVISPVNHKPGEELNPGDFLQIDRVSRLIRDELTENGLETDPVVFSAPGNCSSATADRIAGNLGTAFEADERLTSDETHGPFPKDCDQVIKLVEDYKGHSAIILVTHIGGAVGISDTAACFIPEYFERKLGVRVQMTQIFDGGFHFQCKSTL